MLGLAPWLLSAAILAAGSALVDDVVRMLEQKVPPAAVAEWVDQQQAGPGPLSADDLIRLTRAGAPEFLVQKLLARSSAAPPAVPAPAAPAAVAAVIDQPAVPVRFVLRYEPYEGFELEDQDPLSLYVYLDGRLLAHSRSQTGRLRNSGLVVEQQLAPGPHEIRLLREHHAGRKRRGILIWRHEAEVCPTEIDFEISAGPEHELELSWNEPRFSSTTTPLSWRLRAAGEQVAGAEGLGPPRTDWPQLCEDLELRAAAYDKLPRELRQELDRCVRWNSLWSASGGVPSRAQLLAEIESSILD